MTQRLRVSDRQTRYTDVGRIVLLIVFGFGPYHDSIWSQTVNPKIKVGSRKEKPLPDELKPYFQVPDQWKGQFGPYRSPLLTDSGEWIKTEEEWMERRHQILRWWSQRLGKWPDLITDPDWMILNTKDRGSYLEHKISFHWTPNSETNGYLLIPKVRGKKPAVVTVFYEPETAIGQGKPYRDFALQLVKKGFVSLSIGTTKATEAKTYALYYPSINNATVAPLSMLAYAAANSWHLLASLEDVDSERIGIVGHSFGGKWAMFASCLFDKFACAAWSDPGIMFDEERTSVNYWEPWYLGYHPPPWRKRGLITEDNPAQGLYVELRDQGHDLHLLHALMAPRPVLISGGSEDPPRRWRALNHLVQINEAMGFKKRVGMSNRPEHGPNPESNAIIYQFFEHFLSAQ